LNFYQRIESIKSLIIGAVVGSISLIPSSFVHDQILWPMYLQSSTNTMAQWEYDQDVAAIQCGLFAIMYRYSVRNDTLNQPLKQGIVMSFVIVRSTSRLIMPSYCTALPLYCGSPMGYFDWTLLVQLLLNSIESYIMFQSTASALDASIERGFLSKFPS
jgi:hypothetical protein